MFSHAVNVELRRSHTHARKVSGIQPRQKFALVSLAALLSLGLMMLNIGVLMTARIEAISPILDLPPAYLPGNPLPKDISCTSIAYEYDICSVQFEGFEAYFDFEKGTRAIIDTAVPAQNYTIGYLILSWGSPTGIEKAAYGVTVYWGTHSAILYTKLFKPDSQVHFMIYDLKEHEMSAWRGFQQYR